MPTVYKVAIFLDLGGDTKVLYSGSYGRRVDASRKMGIIMQNEEGLTPITDIVDASNENEKMLFGKFRSSAIKGAVVVEEEFAD